MDKEISGYLLRLRRAHPFLATLSLFANYRFSNSCEKFETDCEVININQDYFRQLTPSERTGLLIHVTLHTALLHPLRCGLRDQQIWNISADIIVNNIIYDTGLFTPPRNTAVETKYRDLSVEQVYEKLSVLPQQSKSLQQAAMKVAQRENDKLCQSKSNSRLIQRQITDVLCKRYPYHADLSAKDQGLETDWKQQSANDEERAPPADHGAKSQQPNENRPKPNNASEQQRLTQHWRNVFRKAETAARMANRPPGEIPAGLLREIDAIMSPELNWRWLLWNFVVRTPTDFEGFDRRFIHQGLYLDQLESDSLKVVVAIDTSGSVSDKELAQFMAELEAITRSYHFIEVELYYVDADIYGPFLLGQSTKDMVPQGGGGTDFNIFFHKIINKKQQHELDVAVYLTDGYSTFPPPPRWHQTLWVVCAGGLESEDFPFGQVARLSSQ